MDQEARQLRVLVHDLDPGAALRRVSWLLLSLEVALHRLELHGPGLEGDVHGLRLGLFALVLGDQLEQLRAGVGEVPIFDEVLQLARAGPIGGVEIGRELPGARQPAQ